MTNPKITLCADDYGFTPGISQGIRELIGLGRLHASSAMTAMPHWPQAAQDFKPLEGRADLGLHLMLTDQVPATSCPRLAPHGRLPSIGQLLRLALTRRLDRAEIKTELNRQFDLFQAHMGRPPDFLDGHHHVHQLPIIRDVVLDLWQDRMAGKGWIRSCWDRPQDILRRGVDPVRALIISELGRVFRWRLKRLGVPHNTSFRGVYDFSGRIPFGRLFRAFTHAPQGATLIMVHPGYVDECLLGLDSLTHQRRVELDFLASDQAPLSLADRHLTWGRLFP